jgi:hypothetical protein
MTSGRKEKELLVACVCICPYVIW